MEEAREKVEKGVREQAREKAREEAREEAREKVRGKAREKVEKGVREQAREKEREKVKLKRAMTHRVVVILGASQPTLALGRQTSNCHVGQDKCGRLTSDSSWTIPSGAARCLSAFFGRLPSERWTDY
jgi:hypothetical protein